jgi:beta-galactosidase/beta-glucuronidase
MMSLLALFATATLWAATPRPEFPEPQFQRELWQNLNGPWEFEFDDANAGLDADWASGSHKFTRTITVPFCFESKLSGIADTSFHPWVWYRRSLTIPDAWKGKRVLLHFGAVDYRAMVWINGRFGGRHEGGNVPFTFDITPLLKAGANTVTVRAEDPPTDRSIPRGKQYWEPKSRGIFYTRTSGIWQTVWMEPVAETHLERVHITPALDGSVRFEASIANPAPDVEFQATVRRRNESVAGAMTRAASSSPAAATLSVSDPRPWSPQSPELYDVVLELRRGGAVIDRVNSYFGFRTVSAENGRILLNGRPIYFKTVLDQGYWPESILTPPSDEAIQYDIRMTRQMGFNGARKHQKIEDPRFLYWADRMGFLVSAEMANAQLYNEDYVARFTREWLDAVARDYNHPSIIVWAPINESWGVPNLRDPRQQNHLKSLYALTRALDPTRLVIDNEGWEHTDMTDLFAIHDYARTGDLLFQKYKDLGKPGVPVPPVARVSVLPGYNYNGTPFYLSEFGGIAFIPAGHQVPAESWGYSGVEKSADAALERLRGIYAAIARLPFAGICYTQITDVEQEVNGLMTYDRKLKFDAKAIEEMNGTLK